MAESLPCGLCKRPPRPGEGLKRVRLAESDMEGMKYPAVKDVGLYQCCPDCHDDYLPVIAKRMGKAPEAMTAHDTI